MKIDADEIMTNDEIEQMKKASAAFAKLDDLVLSDDPVPSALAQEVSIKLKMDKAFLIHHINQMDTKDGN